MTRYGGLGQWSKALIFHTDDHNDHHQYTKRRAERQDSSSTTETIVKTRGAVHITGPASPLQASPHEYSKLRARIHGFHVSHHHTGPRHLESPIGKVHRHLPCLGPLVVLCPHSQTVTLEHGGEHRHHLREEHRHTLVSNKAHRYRSSGPSSVLPAWRLHWSPRSYDVRAEIVPAHPIHACQTLHARDQPGEPQKEIMGRIAVVARGSCSLYKKVISRSES